MMKPLVCCYTRSTGRPQPRCPPSASASHVPLIPLAGMLPRPTLSGGRPPRRSHNVPSSQGQSCSQSRLSTSGCPTRRAASAQQFLVCTLALPRHRYRPHPTGSYPPAPTATPPGALHPRPPSNAVIISSHRYLLKLSFRSTIPYVFQMFKMFKVFKMFKTFKVFKIRRSDLKNHSSWTRPK